MNRRNDQAFQIEAHKLIASGQHGELISQLRKQKKGFIQDPKADFFSIEKLRIQSERATIKKLKEHPAYKTAKEKLLLLQALLNLTVAKRLDNATDTYAADRLVQDSYVIQDFENLINKKKDPFEASRLEMLSLHQSHPTLEVSLLENHLLNLEAIQRMAVEDRERILSVLEDETPFSKYFPQDKKRREAAAQLEHKQEEKKNGEY